MKSVQEGLRKEASLVRVILQKGFPGGEFKDVSPAELHRRP
jgi:hypothetical protein